MGRIRRVSNFSRNKTVSEFKARPAIYNEHAKNEADNFVNLFRSHDKQVIERHQLGIARNISLSVRFNIFVWQFRDKKVDTKCSVTRDKKERSFDYDARARLKRGADSDAFGDGKVVAINTKMIQLK